MSDSLRLLCVTAHPDDESLGVGGTLAKYANEGIDTYLVTATRGERGRFGDQGESPGLDVVGRTREAELRRAASVLKVRGLHFLDYCDGNLDQANPEEAIGRIVNHLRRLKPHVVITFAPEGAYGHPDHIAISQFTTAALVCAADPSYDSDSRHPSHRVAKLYYMAWSEEKWAGYQAAFKDLKVSVDGEDRRATPWPYWAITTSIDTRQYWSTVWKAVKCHQTQMAIYGKLELLSEKHHRALWGSQEFYRTFSLVNGGRQKESDLFEGLR